MTCYCCGKTRHGSNNCPDKEKTPRNEWYINKAMTNLQSGDDTDSKEAKAEEKSPSTDSTASSGKNCKREGWCGFQYKQTQATQLKQSGKSYEGLRDEIILDTGSTLPATFMNPEMVTGIQKTKFPLVMNTNAGSKVLDKQANVIGFGKAWFDEDQMANIFGFAGTVDRYKVTYDSSKEDAFSVHTENGVVKFQRNKDGLYTYKPKECYLEEVAERKKNEANYMVTTVTENKIGYTKRQIADAEKARKLYHNLGCPTIQNFKHILRQNIIQN